MFGGGDHRVVPARDLKLKAITPAELPFLSQMLPTHRSRDVPSLDVVPLPDTCSPLPHALSIASVTCC
jgi:hypothetical protein